MRVVGGKGALRGTLRVPGDKSVCHRAVMLASLAEGVSQVEGFLDGGDTNATCDVLRQLDVHVLAPAGAVRVVHGQGLNGWAEPEAPLDCRNSGTTMRLGAGLLAGQAFTSFLSGTPQLMRRPMGRIVEPLRAMGAQVLGRQGGKLAPLAILGKQPLRGGTRHELAVASAQVKSCLLLAGLYADGPTCVVEPGPSRDHTERLLTQLGVRVETAVVGGGARSVTVWPATSPLRPLRLVVPGDPSSAAFLLVAAAARGDSEIMLEGVGVNPTRTGLLAALERMGARIERRNERVEGGEPVADLLLRQAPLSGTRVAGAEVVTLIDELPILAVAATQAEGETVIADASELRVKETDRIETTAAELCKLGARIETRGDGMVVHGPTPLVGAAVSSHGDHRLAMALAVAGLVASGETRVSDAAVSDDSFPGFVEALRALGGEVEAC
ncbi:MAG: 3-phosphoshikimate 1-carboxyvinyltransferase [Planctomycetota bacterium]